MARGWESKAIEQQQAEAMTPSRTPTAPRTAEQIAQARQREGLRLSRERVIQQIEKAQNPVHRGMLQQALADLDEQLSRLG